MYALFSLALAFGGEARVGKGYILLANITNANCKSKDVTHSFTTSFWSNKGAELLLERGRIFPAPLD